MGGLALSRLAGYGLPALIVAALVGMAVAYQRGVGAERVRWQAAEASTLRAALTRVQQRTAEVAALTAAQDRARQAAEVSYADMQREIDRQRAAVARLGRLRDPGARASCGGAVSAAAGGAGVSADGAAGAELSAGASGFLFDLTARCDRAAAYATACHGWVKGWPVTAPR